MKNAGQSEGGVFVRTMEEPWLGGGKTSRQLIAQKWSPVIN
jgi:hypothetical protein